MAASEAERRRRRIFSELGGEARTGNEKVGINRGPPMPKGGGY